MSYSPMLFVHICAGTLGLLSGTAAICFRKGSRRHVLAGRIFVASMLTMAVGAVYLGIVKHQPNNIGGGILTFYLIGTAWLTARRRDGETSRVDWVWLLIPLTVGVLGWMNGLDAIRSGTGEKYGVPAGMPFHGFRVSACRRGGCSHVGGWRYFWNKAHRAAPVAHVFWPVHRSRFVFPGTLKPSAEIALGSGARKTLIPNLIQHKLVSSSHDTSVDFADFLVSPSSIQKRILGKVDLDR
jgi:uncharacterized membrane protein